MPLASQIKLLLLGRSVIESIESETQLWYSIFKFPFSIIFDGKYTT